MTGKELMLVGSAVSAQLGQDVEAVPQSLSGDEALVVTGNEIFDVTMVMFGKLMVEEELIMVHEVEIELVKMVLDAMVFVVVFESDILLWDMMLAMLIQNFSLYIQSYLTSLLTDDSHV
jgi:hypothetical protein